MKKAKGEIRKEINRRLRDHDPGLRDQRSREIQEKLLLSEEFRASRTVMSYVSLPQEVDTTYFHQEALKQGKTVAVPYIESDEHNMIAVELASIDELEKGPLGIYQPVRGKDKKVSLKEIDLIVVPAVAFDKENKRLGRGKGYYDRFLSQEDLSSAKTIGIAFKFQLIDDLPVTSHDVPVNRVITE